MKSVKVDQLPPSFRKFCATNDINQDIYQSQQQLPRYIRFNDVPTADVIKGAQEQLGVLLQPVPWLPGFFALPQDVKIASSEVYKKGQIFGIDASSGAAVAALNVQPGDHVLDLCTAPGAKLCLVAEQLKLSGTATGVDISRPRLAAARTLVRKYGAAENCRLFLADGSTFDERPPTRYIPEKGSQKRIVGGMSTKESRALKDEDAQRCSQGGALRGEAAFEGNPLEGAAEEEYLRSSRDERSQNAFADSEEECRSAATQGRRDTPVREGHQEKGGTGREFALSLQTPGLSHESQSWQRENDSKSSGPGRCSEDPESLESQPLDEREGNGQVETPPADQILRRSRKRTSHASDGPQRFFYGRGITPPALEVPAGPLETRLYDKVLVDAECTHDGSLKHIQKYDQWGWDTFDRRVMDPQRLASITQLQGRLLENGFLLLKSGGALVYSTCSFTKAQNEAVVSAFLDEHPDAHLTAIPEASNWPCSPGGLPHTLRFDPVVSKTGGLFIAKITKRASGASSEPYSDARVVIDPQANEQDAFMEADCRCVESEASQREAVEDLEAPLLMHKGRVIESTGDGQRRQLWQVVYDEVL